MTTFVRLAQPSDASAMHDIRMSVRENRLSRPDIISEASYQPYIESSSCWVAVNENRIAGFAALDIADSTVWALFVAPDLEGHGIGKKLHKALVFAAAAAGLKNIRLVTQAGSRAAGFYEAVGWKHVGQVEGTSEAAYDFSLVPG